MLCIYIGNIYTYIGVRGMPERDIESLGVMGWGLDAARRFFRRRCRRRPPARGPGWDRLDSRRAERAPLRTGVILDADLESKLR